MLGYHCKVAAVLPTLTLLHQIPQKVVALQGGLDKMSVWSASYSPDTHVPSLKSKVIIITGANGGLGYETVIHLARHSPSKLVLCARSKEKYEKALKGIVIAVPEAVHFVQYLELNLASLSSVQKAAKEFMTENDRLDILMNNAGIMAQPAALTEDGFEIQFGTNHIVGSTHEKTHPACRYS